MPRRTPTQGGEKTGLVPIATKQRSEIMRRHLTAAIILVTG
jgi:hypothetical protein